MIRMAPRTWDVTVAYHRREGWWDERILRVDATTERNARRIARERASKSRRKNLVRVSVRRVEPAPLLHVEVVETATGKVVRKLGPQKTVRLAEKLEDGVNINLDHERFHTRRA